MRPTLVCALLLALPPGVAPCQTIADSGIVRVWLDADEVVIRVNGGEPLTRDAYGNALAAGRDVLLSLPVGIHYITAIYRIGGIAEGPVVVRKNEATTITLGFLTDSSQSDLPIVGIPIDASRLTQTVAESDPPRAEFSIGGFPSAFSTPGILHLPPGEYKMTASAVGYDTLICALVCDSGRIAKVRAILAKSEPAPLTILDLKLEYQDLRPEPNEADASKLRNRFTSATELFLVTPLGQGLALRAFLGDEHRSEANAMIIGGAVLSGGSYLLGQLLGARRHAKIRRLSDEVKEFNARAALHNKDVDRMVREANDNARALWREENRGRGRLSITSP